MTDKAIPIKCFVSHRPTDPFFSKNKKKNRFTIQRSEYFNLQAHYLVLLTAIGIYHVMSLSLINIDTTFFKGCLDIW